MAMQGAIELSVFEIIAREGPDAKLSASQIAAKICKPRTQRQPTQWYQLKAATFLKEELHLIGSMECMLLSTQDRTQGAEHVAGDMFESVPKADAVFMKVSIAAKITFLEDVEAVPPVGEEITSNIAAKITFLGDVQMMTQTPGGEERTEHEFRALATGAGFRGIRIECFVSNLCVMEFFK
ncbi:hypothetical protein Tsubulata_032628 [Turnera subulata]|uniref:O-methyltransferase C-terminal domain-containing protein n=1 Tax=Turnera subulata TaxID=218843 RepID=A0A9Q0JHR1_9ROSI|nr:hypothetical protein Tsubulata_032628 [Turnera subulata]